MSDYYPDLFSQAIQSSSRDLTQIASIFVMAARQSVRRRARRERLRVEQDQNRRQAIQARETAARAAARVRWAPANDPEWLHSAGLTEMAEAWGAAVAYQDDPAAGAALRNCEDRLRYLHPSAMAHYDRLRADGLGPLEAIRASAAVFMLRPAWEGSVAVQRLELPPGAGLGHSWTAAVHGPTRADLDREMQRRRGVQISDRMQRRSVMSPDELRVSLETRTNLPAEVISEVVASRPVVRVAQRPWQQDFPFPIKDVVAAAAVRRDSGLIGTVTPERRVDTAPGHRRSRR